MQSRLKDAPVSSSQPIGGSAMEQLCRLVASEMEEVKTYIGTKVESLIPLIPLVSNYIISSGGKRMRPMLVLASARLCGYSGKKHISLAACVEFFHTATLLHDDVVDGSSLRRGEASANALWGDKASVLVGDFLLGRAFEMSVQSGSQKVMQILSETAVKMSEGEVLQLSVEHDIAGATEYYEAVITAKTAELFSAACRMGAALSGLSEEKEAALGEYGLQLGRAFQVADDMLDYSAAEEKLGKAIGKDFAEQKVTLPVILAYKQASTEEERSFWHRVMEEAKQTPQDFMQARIYLEKRNIIAKVLQEATKYKEAAKAALASFPNSQTKTILLGLADYVLEREF